MATEFSISKFKNIVINLLRAALLRLGDPLMAELVAEADSEPGNSLQLGDVQIDFQAHEVSRGDERIPLTPSEYEILMTLASGHGETVDYASLVKSALDYDVGQEEAKELIKRHIFTLRQKIGPDFEVPRYIVNVRGYGYRLISEEN